MDGFIMVVLQKNVLIQHLYFPGKGDIYTIKMKPNSQPSVWDAGYDIYKAVAGTGVIDDYSSVEAAGITIAEKLLRVTKKSSLFKNAFLYSNELGKGSDKTYYIKAYLKRIEVEILKKLPQIVMAMNPPKEYSLSKA